MTHDDNWSRGDVAAHHSKDDEPTGDRERNYAEHLSARKLSLAERMVVAGALVLLGFAGLTAHLGSAGSPSVAAATAVPASLYETIDSSEYCREHSPFPGREC